MEGFVVVVGRLFVIVDWYEFPWGFGGMTGRDEEG
jgi:hypothetical protein